MPALNFRQGYKNWKIQVWENGLSQQEFIFPRCNEAGAPEDHAPVSLTKTALGGRRKNKLRGHYSTFNFNYERYTPPIVLDQLKYIVDAWIYKENYSNLELILFPRLDILGRYFSVFPSEETIRVGIMKGQANAKGNKGVILKFHSIELIKSFPIADPNDRSIGLINLTTL